MLMSEQKRLKERKAHLENLQTSLPRLTAELAAIKRENERLRSEVSNAVEDEVHRAIERQYQTSTRGGQPLQINRNSATSRRQSDLASLDMPRQMNDDRASLLERKRQELATWEG